MKMHGRSIFLAFALIFFGSAALGQANSGAMQLHVAAGTNKPFDVNLLVKGGTPVDAIVNEGEHWRFSCKVVRM
jgi:hypothetical protein